MSLYARGDKFGVVEANHLLTGGIDRSSGGGAHEVRVFLESGDYVWKIYDDSISDWKVIEKTRSIGRNYHGVDVVDDNNAILIPIYVDASHKAATLKLWGQPFPTYHYTELPAHDHGGAAFANSSHVHAGPNHRHDVGTLAVSNGGSHDHGGATGGQSNSHTHTPGGGAGTSGGASTGHTHSIPSQANHGHGLTGETANSGTGNTGAPSATAAINSQGINGGTLNDTQKTLVDDLIEIYITAVQGTWGTAKTKLTSGWSSLANINANGGTDDINIFSYLSVGSYIYIRIVEPTAKKGGKILWHVSLS